MDNKIHRVVITGMGAVSPVGNNVSDMWDSMREGICGIGEITQFDTSNFKVKIAGEVKDFDPTLYIEKKEAKRMDRFCTLGLTAASEAAEQSGIADFAGDRLGVCVGSGIGGMNTMYTESVRLYEKGPLRVSPLFVPTMITNILAGHIAIKYKAYGSCTSIVTACATGSHSIGEAYRQIKHGYLDAAFAGGSEAAITPLGVAGFVNLSALCESNDPKRASIPFDKERSGFVMGEGAGILVLESLEHAKKRGAKILGEICGYGSTCDAYHITAPEQSGSGAAKAIEMALADGGVKPQEVGYINAHGTSTHYNDLCETEAIKKAFGDAAYKVKISSTKSMTGHLLGAAGGIEAIACVKAIQSGVIPPTIGYTVPDPELDLDYTPNKVVKADIKYAMSNSLGFGGHNASLLFKKFED